MAGPQDLSADQLPLLRRLAREHLADDVAERWLRFARPAVQLLTPADAAGDPAYADLPPVGRLGGLPSVPPGFAWPVWEGHGPLPLVAEVDLGTLATAGIDPGLPLPRSGRLLAFYFDGAFLQDDGIVMADEPESLAGMRLLHLDDDPAARVAPEVPDGLHVYPERPLRGRQAWSHPHWTDTALDLEFGDPDRPDDLASHHDWMDHPVNDDDFADALDVLRAPGVGVDDVHHQLGGWAQHVQHTVEEEVADDPLRWRPVLQVGSEPRLRAPEVPPDDEMMWGDAGALYWLARDDRLPDLADVRFTWQCG